MSNGTMAAVAAGVISFAAAFGGAFFLIESKESPVLQGETADTSALEKRIASLEKDLKQAQEDTKRNARRSKKSTGDNSGLDAYMSINDKRIKGLESRISSLGTNTAPSGSDENATIEEPVGPIKPAAFKSMMETYETNRRNERREVALADFKEKAPARLAGELKKKMEELGLNEGTIQNVTNAYTSRIDAMVAAAKQLEDLRSSGEEVSDEIVKQTYADAVAASNQAVKDAVGEENYDSVSREMAAADFRSQGRGRDTGLGTAIRTVNAEAFASFRNTRQRGGGATRGNNRGGGGGR